MTIAELRRWQFENSLEDKWWLFLDDVMEEYSLDISTIEQILSEPYRIAKVCHDSQAGLPNPPWIEIATAAPQSFKGVGQVLTNGAPSKGIIAKVESKSNKRKKITGKQIKIGIYIIIGLYFFLIWTGRCTPIGGEAYSRNISNRSSSSTSGQSNSDTRKASKRETRKPTSSGWDGGVSQVERYIKANAKDANSIEFIDWSPVEKLAGDEYRVRAKYRGKNGFGGYTIENKIFFLRYDDYDYEVYRTQDF